MSTKGRALGLSIRTEGGLLPADLLARIAANDPQVPGLTLAAYHLDAGLRFGEAITRSWNRLIGAWAAFQAERAALPAGDPGTTVTRERWLLPLFDELGYGRLQRATAIEITGKSYAVSHAWSAVPIHLIGCRVVLDRRTERVAGAAGQAPHGLVQELLNRSPERLWGFVSNGLSLRILRDNATLTRQAYVEFDLEAIFDGEAYADFALLWLVAHQSRVEGEKPETCWLEQWTTFAAEAGTRALDKLRAGVETAITALGSGFLGHPANGELRDALRGGALDKQDYYRELLRLVYRLLFLFTAEDRGLLLDPGADEPTQRRYLDYYSTARLRRLGERRKGSRHADLWAGLKVVLTALASDTGAPGLGLPALGGFLFSGDACPRLDPAELANRDLLDAVRALATIEDGRVRRSVDYRNLGAEELGGVYESLLELHPELDANTGTFALTTAGGHERKTTGSYYTPTSLINALLDSALDPVLAEATAQPNPERAILNLKVVDPAAGSGHFLVAAAHRIAKRLATVRTGDEEPSPGATRTALRDVIGHCIYAVDVNPMAVELCKVSLWLEAIEPGKPLSFLDAHVRCGNSLLGATPILLEQGVPDGAYAPIEGDEKTAARELTKRNRVEREGQLTMGEAIVRHLGSELAQGAATLGALPDERIVDLRAKEARFRELTRSEPFAQATLLADAWCAAFVARKASKAPAVTSSVLREIARNPSAVANSTLDEIRRLADEYRFFHWHVEFPDVFRLPRDDSSPENAAAGWSGGFDCVLGNPPWDTVELHEQEFFAERSPRIANAANAAARKHMIAGLEQDDRVLWTAYRSALRRVGGESHFLRDSGRYPLAGRGRINTYSVFVETVRLVLGRRGRAGVIVPTAIATDDTTSPLFRSFVVDRALHSLLDFRNNDALFPDVGHRRFKFCLLTLGGPGTAQTSDFYFFAVAATDLADVGRHVTLAADDFALLNPNTGTCPIFRSRRDAELTRAIYRRVPILVNEARGEDTNPWGASFMQGLFNMASDSGLFRTREQLENADGRLEGNLFYRGDERYLPLYEGKMVHQFDHRYGDYAMRPDGSLDSQLPDVPVERMQDPTFTPMPRYWVQEREVASRLDDRWRKEWLFGWRDITNATNERTTISAVFPRAAAGGIHLMITASSGALQSCLVSALNSFVVDYVARQKTRGVHLAFFTMKQLPVLPPRVFEGTAPWSPGATVVDWIAPRACELSYTAWDLEAFGRGVGWQGPPFRWDPERRFLIRCEIDAAFFHLYGIQRDDADFILDTFPIVRRNDERRYGEYRSKRVTLEIYDAMADASQSGRAYQTILDPPPADPAVAHLPRPGEPAGRWLPLTEAEHSASLAGTHVGPQDRSGQRSMPPAVISIESQLAEPVSVYPEPAPAYRRAAESTAPAPATSPTQGTLADLARAAAASADWLPEEAVDTASVVPGRRIRHRRFGEGVIIEVRRTVKPPTVTIRFGASDDREIAIGYGLIEFEVE